jgi:hypothetical protein
MEKKKLDIKKFGEMAMKSFTPEMFTQIIESNRQAAVEAQLQSTWRGIAKIPREYADIICAETCTCWQSWMPPVMESIIENFYDKDNPDVDEALTVNGTLELMAAKAKGDTFEIHRKGNIATLITSVKTCLCPFTVNYNIIEPNPNKCTCPARLYEQCYMRLYNVPLKARTIESFHRGGKRCAFEFEFPPELIKTPEFHFPAE